MARPYLVVSDIETLATQGGYSGMALLNNYSTAILLSAMSFVRLYGNWQGASYDLTQAEKDNIDFWCAQIESELMNSAVGLIFPIANSIAPSGTLYCDGTQYLRTDYPDLYDVLDSAFIVDANNFVTPDLTNRFIYGTGTNSPGQTGGAETVSLTESELPSHNHTYTAPSTSVSLEGTGVPIPNNDGTILSSTGSVGGGQSHNNMPPFMSLAWVIVSGYS